MWERYCKLWINKENHKNDAIAYEPTKNGLTAKRILNQNPFNNVNINWKPKKTERF